MFALGMTLFAITLTMNVFAELVRRRFREEY
jgi:phosphate transport system permease protein